MSDSEHLTVILILATLLVFVIARKRRKPSAAFGTAAWMSEGLMRKLGMFAGRGLLLGRTLSGAVLCIPRYCHVLCIGSPGSGKTVSVILPNLFRQRRTSSSCVVFDTKGELYQQTAKRLGGRVIRLAPFSDGKEKFNPFDTIPASSPLLIDHAKAMANAIVVRTGLEHDSHWNDSAENVISGVSILVLMQMRGMERTLSSVREICCSAPLLLKAAEHLVQIGSIPARMGNSIFMLFETMRGADGQAVKVLGKEGASVMSTVLRHLSFLDSNMVEESVSSSTFQVEELLRARTTLFLQIPPEMLESQRGLLRLWVATLIRVLGREGSERQEILFLLDEASALGGLSALEEAMVRGRSAGLRLLLVYQSDSQVKKAFPNKESLLYDNCSTQIYLGATGIETAERISKSLGDYTQTIRSYGRNSGGSSQFGQNGQSTTSYSWGQSSDVKEDKRALLDPSEVLRLDKSLLIALVQGQYPILARRILWYSDSLFARKATGNSPFLWLVLVACAIALILLGLGGSSK
jgi:type IV secretion system protein VirD4